MSPDWAPPVSAGTQAVMTNRARTDARIQTLLIRLPSVLRCCAIVRIEGFIWHSSGELYDTDFEERCLVYTIGADCAQFWGWVGCGVEAFGFGRQNGPRGGPSMAGTGGMCGGFGSNSMRLAGFGRVATYFDVTMTYCDGVFSFFLDRCA